MPDETFARYQEMAQQLAESFAPYQEMAQQLAESVAPLHENVRKWTDAIEGWSERLRISLIPSNLVGMEGRSEDLLDVTKDGIPMAWVMPPVFLEQILATDSNPREVIAGAEESIIDLCGGVVAALGDQVNRLLLEEAIELHAEQRFAGCQSIAANLIDSLLREKIGETDRPARPYSDDLESYTGRTAEDRFEGYELGGSALYLAQLTLQPVCSATSRCYKSDPLPLGFNRHATAHRIIEVGAVTRQHSLIAAMLAVSICAFFDDW